MRLARLWQIAKNELRDSSAAITEGSASSVAWHVLSGATMLKPAWSEATLNPCYCRIPSLSQVQNASAKGAIASKVVIARARRLIRQMRTRDRSVQHAIGIWDWGGLQGLGVWPQTLCPRPETELLSVFASMLVERTHRNQAPRSAEAVFGSVVAGSAGNLEGLTPEMLWYPSVKTVQALGAALAPDSSSVTASTSGKHRQVRVLDVCSGTGAIGLSILHRCQYDTARVVGVDITERCCRLARINASLFGLDTRHATFVQGDASDSTWDMNGLQDAVLKAFHDSDTAASADVVVMNPPYIPPAELANISPHVIRSDGITALAGGGIDGLDLPIKILRAIAVSNVVRADTVIAIELHQDQPIALRQWLHNQHDSTENRKPCPQNLRWLAGGRDMFGSLRFAFLAIT